MNDNQKSKFIKQIIGAYPTFEPTPERLEIWSRHMSEMDYELAIKRLDKHVKTSKFPPTIAEILNPEQPKKKPWEEPDSVGPAVIINGGWTDLM